MARPSIRRLSLLLAILLSPSAHAVEQDTPWLRFSEMMRQLSRDPVFVETVIRHLGRGPAASAMLGPADRERLRALIRKRDWDSLDRFPVMTVAGIGRAMIVAKPVARRHRSTAPAEAARAGLADAVEDLGIPTGEPPPRAKDLIRGLGHGVESGAVYDVEAAKFYPDSRRLAELLNRLALNPPPGQPGPRLQVRLGERRTQTAEGLVGMLAARGHEVSVRDARYFANFGNLRYRRRDVITPFWIDTRLPLPNRRETLIIPATHSQHELRIRGSQVNADVFFYFGIDGEAAFRAFAVKDQAWILGRNAWIYRGEKALEAVRLAAAIRRTYASIQREHPALPFGGYYALGVCNDVSAMIELRLHGRATLYPLTRDPELFPKDEEVGRLARALPSDRRGLPDLDRVLGAMPTDDLARLPFPGLRADLAAIRAQQRQGPPAARRGRVLWPAAALVAVLFWLWRRQR
ncbi:MAG: hypothetical protein NTY77_04380 [Elusimicrobia bacterium]|nr:hypothetical protein [Elusimicrobiota bacterium]